MGEHVHQNLGCQMCLREIADLHAKLEQVTDNSLLYVKWQHAEARARRLEEVAAAAQHYLDASSRLYVESGNMVTPKARAKAVLIDALAALAPERPH